MIDQTLVIFLAVVLATASGITAYLTLGNRKASQTDPRKIPSDVATKRRLYRETRNARRAETSGRAH